MLRGVVVEAGSPVEVDTQTGRREVAELSVQRTDDPDATDDPVRVSLWGDWADTATRLTPGMTVAVTAPERSTYDGRPEFATTATSFVIVEPDYLVDVTALRSWVQCPRMQYLDRLSATPLAYPVVRGTLVHEVFGALLRGRDRAAAVADAVADAGLDLGLLGRDPESVTGEIDQHARALEAWLRQSTFDADDTWRSERTLLSEHFGLKGRADAVRNGAPIELKTGKNAGRSPRFHDKIQVACYALLLGDQAATTADGDATAIDEAIVPACPDTATVLYTRNATDDDAGAPAKDVSLGRGLFSFVVRERNRLVTMAVRDRLPTGEEADAHCPSCFEQDVCMAVAGRLGQTSKAGRVGTALPAVDRAYFGRFYRAIERERRAVHGEYAKLWRQSAAERADDDRALIDLEPLGRHEREDGRWDLRARRPERAVSKIRVGDYVLASDGHPTRGTAETGQVRSLDPVTVTVDEPLELRRVDVYPSELGVDRMLTALHDGVLTGDERRRDLLMGRAAPAFDRTRATDETFIENNDAQDRAIRTAIQAEDCALVQGPPGTGKTYTLARLVRALVARDERVLVTAFTNRAVDNALLALREQGFDDFVRVGTETGVSEAIDDARLDERGPPDERRAALQTPPVVGATTATCGSRVLRECSFDVAVVDEAGQLTEPDVMAAIGLADRFVLVGDHKQLPPVVQADLDDAVADPTAPVADDASIDDGTGRETAPTAGPDRSEAAATPFGQSPAGHRPAALSRSLFERLIERHPEAGVRLERQYRMNQRIQYFASREFYDGALRPATPAIAGQRLSDREAVDVAALPDPDVVFHVDPGGRQTGNTNPIEAARVRAIVDRYLEAGVTPAEVGVIAPFRAQVAEIADRVPDAVTVDTVDRFQGSARDVIVVSFVATDALDGPIFEDYRRVNVALTRARRALCLVGDPAALESDPFYARMLAWARGTD